MQWKLGDRAKLASFLVTMLATLGTIFEVDTDFVQELLTFHNQKLTIDELIEMHEQDIEELESLGPVQLADRMMVVGI
ncbi:hypothetical protein TNCV_2078331 [Trichonephila clavipes]|nr:hypothetical protein TNCV_2078331 [Trichonephila clavipes]